MSEKCERCERCGGQLAFTRTWIEQLEPDQEPFEAGICEEIASIDTTIIVWGWVCVTCGEPDDLWYRPENWGSEDQDANLHDFRKRLTRARKREATEKARAEQAEAEVEGLREALVWLVSLHHGIAKDGGPPRDSEWKEALGNAKALATKPEAPSAAAKETPPMTPDEGLMRQALAALRWAWAKKELIGWPACCVGVIGGLRVRLGELPAQGEEAEDGKAT